MSLSTLSHSFLMKLQNSVTDIIFIVRKNAYNKRTDIHILQLSGLSELRIALNFKYITKKNMHVLIRLPPAK